MTENEQQPQGDLARRPRGVGADHHPPARPAVGGHAAEEEQGQPGQLLDAEHHAEVGGRVGLAQHGERQGDRYQTATERRHRLTGEDLAEAGVTQRPEGPATSIRSRPAHPPHRSLALGAAAPLRSRLVPTPSAEPMASVGRRAQIKPS